MSPVLSERHRVGESMILPHSVATSRVLSASYGLDESDVHHLVVEILHGDGTFDVVLGGGRIGEDDGSVVL